MRILHIITSLRTGGAERLVTELALRHQAGGDQVEVLLFDGTSAPLVKELELGGVMVHALGKGSSAMYNPLLLPRLVRFLRKHPFDIVHTHNTPCQFLTALVPSQTLVTTEHGTQNRRRSWRWFRPLDRWMYGRYRLIVCVGEETRETLSAWLAKPGLTARMTVIANGIDLQRMANAVPAEDIAATNGYKVLMVSAFRPEKDQQTLIRAISELPKTYHLFLAGGAETPENRKVMEACQALAKEQQDRITFLGIRTDIPALLAAADVVVLSSHHEGMSMSILEAMAAAKPVVASDVPGLSDLVRGAGVLVPPGDPEALARTIKDICENPDLARKIGRRCQERAQKYDIDETARQYRRLYQNL